MRKFLFAIVAVFICVGAFAATQVTLSNGTSVYVNGTGGSGYVYGGSVGVGTKCAAQLNAGQPMPFACGETVEYCRSALAGIYSSIGSMWQYGGVTATAGYWYYESPNGLMSNITDIWVCTSSGWVNWSIAQTYNWDGGKQLKGVCTGSSISNCYLYADLKCRSGYYGSFSTSCTSCSCSQCPSPGTSPAGSDSKSDCYIPSGTTGLTDTMGTYTTVYSCPWS